MPVRSTSAMIAPTLDEHITGCHRCLRVCTSASNHWVTLLIAYRTLPCCPVMEGNGGRAGAPGEDYACVLLAAMGSREGPPPARQRSKPQDVGNATDDPAAAAQEQQQQRRRVPPGKSHSWCVREKDHQQQQPSPSSSGGGEGGSSSGSGRDGKGGKGGRQLARASTERWQRAVSSVTQGLSVVSSFRTLHSRQVGRGSPCTTHLRLGASGC